MKEFFLHFQIVGNKKHVYESIFSILIKKAGIIFYIPKYTQSNKNLSGNGCIKYISKSFSKEKSKIKKTIRPIKTKLTQRGAS